MSSIINYVADGSTSTFQIPFNFIDRAHVVVTVDGTTITPTFINDAQLSISPTPTSGLKITVKRETPVGALVDFTDGSTLFEADLDLAHKQNRFIAEESSDRADSAIDTLNANITNINTVATDTAAINTVSGSITNVNTVATNMAEVLLADTNAATATTKASEASVSATASEASKVISVTKAGEASASAASALASKNAAATSETNAAGSAATATTQANLATTNGATQVALATNQVSLATDQANLATTNGAAQVTLATAQTSLATTQASNAAGSAATASTQAGISTTKASEASASATAAAASAASITDEEANAAASASAAAGSATDSANSAASAAAALDSFDDRYLGSKASDPTLDNDGNALVAGALYFNSTANEMRVYDGGNWIAASSAGAASLILYEYTATNAQTTFSGADDNAASMSYAVGNIQVVLNGVILDPSDFTATSGTSIVLASGAATGDLLNVYAFKSFTVADTVSASAGGTFGGNIDVTGTVTADGLTVDGTPIRFNSTAPMLYFMETGVADSNHRIRQNAGNLYFQKLSDDEATATDRMLIDGGTGNVLVGTTSSFGSSGITLGSNSVIYAAASSQNVANFQRYTTDGEIVRFGKDGSTVGSIFSGHGGSQVGIGTNTTGITFNPATRSMMPANPSSTNPQLDATLDIGFSSVRWKDLYLSGGVYLGGTGSANKLDDYEEGTWTPTFTPDTSGSLPLQSVYDTMQYVKIGNWVTLSGFIRAATPSSPVGSSPTVGNFPFTVANLADSAGRSSGSVSYFDDSAGNWSVLPCYIVESQTQAYVKIDSSTIGANDGFYISLNYRTT